MMDFIKTVMGKRFFEGQLPRLITNLDRIATALEKANELKEKELAEQVPSSDEVISIPVKINDKEFSINELAELMKVRKDK